MKVKTNLWSQCSICLITGLKHVNSMFYHWSQEYCLLAFQKIQTFSQNTDQIQTYFKRFSWKSLYYRPKSFFQTVVPSVNTSLDLHPLLLLQKYFYKKRERECIFSKLEPQNYGIKVDENLVSKKGDSQTTLLDLHYIHLQVNFTFDGKKSNAVFGLFGR